MVSATTTYTPEQVAEIHQVGSAWYIRQLCKDRKLAHIRGAKGRILLNDDHVKQFLAMHQQEALPTTTGSGQTARSAARRRGVA